MTSHRVDRTEQAAREQTIKRLQGRHDQIHRYDNLDKLDGRITQEFFDKQAAEWRSEQEVLLDTI